MKDDLHLEKIESKALKSNDRNCNEINEENNERSCDDIEENMSSDTSTAIKFHDTKKESKNNFHIETEEVAMKPAAKSLLVLSPAGTGSTLLCTGIAIKVRNLMAKW